MLFYSCLSDKIYIIVIIVIVLYHVFTFYIFYINSDIYICIYIYKCLSICLHHKFFHHVIVHTISSIFTCPVYNLIIFYYWYAFYITWYSNVKPYFINLSQVTNSVCLNWFCVVRRNQYSLNEYHIVPHLLFEYLLSLIDCDHKDTRNK